MLVGGALGTIVPIIAWWRYYFYDYLFGSAVVMLWPSSIVLMATDGHEHDPDVWVIIAIALLSNIILYAAIAALLWFTFWFICCGRMRSHDQNATSTRE